jgi:hypothetical protein
MEWRSKGRNILLSQSTCAINSMELREVDVGRAAPADTCLNAPQCPQHLCRSLKARTSLCVPV